MLRPALALLVPGADMSDPSTTARIEQQREIATAVAQIKAMRDEHNTAMLHINGMFADIKTDNRETKREIHEALKEIFSWNRKMEEKHVEGVKHCSTHDAKILGHDARLNEHDGRINAIESRHDESSTEELAAAVAKRLPILQQPAPTPEAGNGSAWAKPSTILSLGLIAAGLILLVVLLSIASNRHVNTIVPPIPMPAGDK